MILEFIMMPTFFDQMFFKHTGQHLGFTESIGKDYTQLYS